MDLGDLALLITAIVAGLVTTGAALAKAWRSIIERALLERQSKAAIDAKNDEISELKRRNAELWDLLEGLTK